MTKNSSYNSAQSYLGLYAGLGLIFLIIGFLPFLDIEQQKNLLTEGGLFESLTVYLYKLALAKNTIKLVSIRPDYSFCPP